MNWNQALYPSLHHRKEGWLRHQENFAQPPKLTQPGWFSFCSHRKTTPASRLAEASQSFFDRSATPPCGDARRGIALFQFLHSSIERRYSSPVRVVRVIRGSDFGCSFAALRLCVPYPYYSNISGKENVKTRFRRALATMISL